MTGTYTIKAYNRRLRFELQIERNITVIRGDSATGKTTLIGMLRDYEEHGADSGVSVVCERPCRVLTNTDWEERLRSIDNSIVFIDEGNPFVCSREFAEAIRGTTNYYVLITRESLHQLPYSVEAVLELRKTSVRSSGNTKCTYNKAYPYYKTVAQIEEQLSSFSCIVTEDSNAGHQMFEHIAARVGTPCMSAGGKSNILRALSPDTHSRVLAVADGAAFGADMENIYQFQLLHPGRLVMYLPESFEWLLLKAGIVRDTGVEDILQSPSDYIDSAKYFSWEQYFFELLTELTQANQYMRYSKSGLGPFYFQEENIRKILRAIEEK